VTVTSDSEDFIYAAATITVRPGTRTVTTMVATTTTTTTTTELKGSFLPFSAVV